MMIVVRWRAVSMRIERLHAADSAPAAATRIFPRTTGWENSSTPASISFGRMRLISPDVPAGIECLLVTVEHNHDAKVRLAVAVTVVVDGGNDRDGIEHELVGEMLDPESSGRCLLPSCAVPR